MLRFFLCCAPKALRGEAAKADEVALNATIAMKNIRIFLIG